MASWARWAGGSAGPGAWRRRRAPLRPSPVLAMRGPAAAAQRAPLLPPPLQGYNVFEGFSLSYGLSSIDPGAPVARAGRRRRRACRRALPGGRQPPGSAARPARSPAPHTPTTPSRFPHAGFTYTDIFIVNDTVVSGLYPGTDGACHSEFSTSSFYSTTEFQSQTTAQ